MVSSSRPTAAFHLAGQDWLCTWSASSAHHLSMTASQLCSRSTKAVLPFVVSIVATHSCLAWARHDAMHCAMGMPDVGLPHWREDNATVPSVHTTALRVQGIACSAFMTTKMVLLDWPRRSGPRVLAASLWDERPSAEASAAM